MSFSLLMGGPTLVNVGLHINHAPHCTTAHIMLQLTATRDAGASTSIEVYAQSVLFFSGGGGNS